MAILGTNNPTLVDIANSMDPNGSVASVAEVLNQTNAILEDMPFFESNLPTGHRSIIRTGLPTATWRKFYQGVPPSKSTRAPVVDSVGMLEARNEIDKDECELNGNTNAFRLTEAFAEVEGMNQLMATTVFYGDTTQNPEQFHGLVPRYNAIASSPIMKQNIIDGGGTGSVNTSVWLVVWGPQTIFGIFPKGSKAGLVHEDLGLIDSFDSNNYRFRSYADRWQWKCGIVVKDWRYAVRICNIDVTNLVNQTSAADLISLMIRAEARIPYLTMGRPVFYCSRTVREMLNIQALNKSNYALSISEAAGQFKTTFMGIPIKTVDALLLTEARVV
jgi:hypothetical protein